MWDNTGMTALEYHIQEYCAYTGVSYWGVVALVKHVKEKNPNLSRVDIAKSLADSAVDGTATLVTDELIEQELGFK